MPTLELPLELRKVPLHIMRCERVRVLPRCWSYALSILLLGRQHSLAVAGHDIDIYLGVVLWTAAMGIRDVVREDSEGRIDELRSESPVVDSAV